MKIENITLENITKQNIVDCAYTEMNTLFKQVGIAEHWKAGRKKDTIVNDAWKNVESLRIQLLEGKDKDAREKEDKETKEALEQLALQVKLQSEIDGEEKATKALSAYEIEVIENCKLYKGEECVSNLMKCQKQMNKPNNREKGKMQSLIRQEAMWTAMIKHHNKKYNS